MKKIFLSMVFVFATGTMINANTNTNAQVGPEEDCIEESIKIYNFLSGFTGENGYAFKVSEAVLDNCLEEVTIY